jgi:hypothetical protein
MKTSGNPWRLPGYGDPVLREKGAEKPAAFRWAGADRLEKRRKSNAGAAYGQKDIVKDSLCCMPPANADWV